MNHVDLGATNEHNFGIEISRDFKPQDKIYKAASTADKVLGMIKTHLCQGTQNFGKGICTLLILDITYNMLFKYRTLMFKMTL